jgi:zinc transport system substrate-binding protein
MERSVADKINSNSLAYIDQIKMLDHQITDIASEIGSNTGTAREAVIFHDAFAYLANRIGITVAHTVPLDSDTSLSAGDIGEIIDEVQAGNIHYLFTEVQYSDSIASQIAAETDASVYIIDSAVTGDGSMDSYIQAMQKNIETLKELVK